VGGLAGGDGREGRVRGGRGDPARVKKYQEALEISQTGEELFGGRLDVVGGSGGGKV